MKKNVIILIVVALIIVIGGYAFVRYRSMQQANYVTSSAPTDVSASPSPTNNITSTQGPSLTVSNFTFAPATITVSAGDIVTIINNDTVAHTVVSDDGTSFSTGNINPGSSATITAPTTAGTYTYHCSIHPMMKGTIIVQ